MKHILLLGSVLLSTVPIWSQDSSSVQQMETVVIQSPNGQLSSSSNKPLGMLEEQLKQSVGVNMIRRGAYAWEPMLNGMTSSRSVVTIDGMRIYAACTDLMDPVTSYLETANIGKVEIHSGPSSGTKGSTIAGQLNITTLKGDFGEPQLSGSVRAGWESNNQQRILGTSLLVQQQKWYLSTNLNFRKASNYHNGNGEEVLYSGFAKYNAGLHIGYKVNKFHQFEASMIYDVANNVGYPGLTMDVGKAEGIITSWTHSYHNSSKAWYHWETKIYYNHINHAMDDSKRPDVPIRMDMPGVATTWGVNSNAMAKVGAHKWTLSWNAHTNYSIANMVMYPNNPNEKPMYMLTWPGVRTVYTQFQVADKWKMNNYWSWTNNIGMAVQRNNIDNETGRQSLSLFYPQLPKSTWRWLPQFNSQVELEKNGWRAMVALGYTERAPTISEAYGYYLFNNFDNYDYVGNPFLNNEKSWVFQTKFSKQWRKLHLQLQANYFYLQQYILGENVVGLSPMTIGADGVRRYVAIDNAHIVNLNWSAKYYFAKQLYWEQQFSYKKGMGANGVLPMIQPFQWQSEWFWDTPIGLWKLGALYQARFNNGNSYYGETATQQFIIFNTYWSKKLTLGHTSFTIHAGVDNILTKNYATFADWRMDKNSPRIAQMGRNIFLHIVLHLGQN